jgi:hypothetical protein
MYEKDKQDYSNEVEDYLIQIIAHTIISIILAVAVIKLFI